MSGKDAKATVCGSDKGVALGASTIVASLSTEQEWNIPEEARSSMRKSAYCLHWFWDRVNTAVEDLVSRLIYEDRSPPLLDAQSCEGLTWPKGLRLTNISSFQPARRLAWSARWKACIVSPAGYTECPVILRSKCKPATSSHLASCRSWKWPFAFVRVVVGFGSVGCHQSSSAEPRTSNPPRRRRRYERVAALRWQRQLQTTSSRRCGALTASTKKQNPRKEVHPVRWEGPANVTQDGFETPPHMGIYHRRWLKIATVLMNGQDGAKVVT